MNIENMYKINKYHLHVITEQVLMQLINFINEFRVITENSQFICPPSYVFMFLPCPKFTWAI